MPELTVTFQVRPLPLLTLNPDWSTGYRPTLWTVFLLHLCICLSPYSFLLLSLSQIQLSNIFELLICASLSPCIPKTSWNCVYKIQLPLFYRTGNWETQRKAVTHNNMEKTKLGIRVPRFHCIFVSMHPTMESWYYSILVTLVLFFFYQTPPYSYIIIWTLQEDPDRLRSLIKCCSKKLKNCMAERPTF